MNCQRSGPIEEIPVGRAHVRGRRHARAAAQHQLVRHELAVVLAERACERLVARIGRVAARGPLPHVAEELRRRRPRARDGGAPIRGSCRRGARRSPRSPTRPRSAAACRPSAHTRRPRSSSRGRPARSRRLPSCPPSVMCRHAPSLRSQYNGACQPRSLHRAPPVGQPQLGARIAAVGDERHELAVGDEPVGERGTARETRGAAASRCRRRSRRPPSRFRECRRGKSSQASRSDRTLRSPGARVGTQVCSGLIA